MSEYVTCTPHRANARFHISFEDFEDLNDHDAICANALRVFEVMTNDEIKHLRFRHRIPGDHLPHEDDLWLEVSCRDLEWWSVNVRRKSAYARALLPAHPRHPTLIERGFLRCRYVARREETRPLFGEDGKVVRFPRPRRPIYHDSRGDYIVVDDASGGYEVEGRQYSAATSGYMKVVRQFLYEIEAVNAAIADLDGNPPPKPFKRWRSIAAGEKYEESVQSQEATTYQEAPLSSLENESLAGARRGSSLTTAGNAGSFAYHDNTISYQKTMDESPRPQNSKNYAWTGASSNGQGRPKAGRCVRRWM